ncbi:PREDICTED: phosphatidylinositol phosphatase PTPRQ-like [Branchiostoma belcheri]|uniref:protein-tyrosine-phosphatase n=1 Tax=Branchiostoma belcheri TaxID=7741 RepID=A0A6P4ZVD3_BRABE|nr:PREDICTED: phosphatidylinositol phosphatase PTPRQ-like [Branchiostoma belcheri]
MEMESFNDCPQNPTYTISDLTPGAVYSLTVAAQSGGRPSAASTPVMEQTEPVPPTNVTFDLVNVTSLVVMWGSAAGVHDGYNLTCTSCEGVQARPLSLSDNHTRHQYDGLIRGEMYNFTIITVSGPKYSQPTEIIQFIDPAPVETITELSVYSRNVSLAWQPPEGVYSHFIVKVTSDSGESMMVKSNSLNVTLVDLTPGTLYNFTVYTVSGNKESVGTGYGPVPTLEEPPGPVSNLTLVATSSTTLQVSWQPPEEPNGVLTSYTLRVRNSADMEWNNNCWSTYGHLYSTTGFNQPSYCHSNSRKHSFSRTRHNKWDDANRHSYYISPSKHNGRNNFYKCPTRDNSWTCQHTKYLSHGYVVEVFAATAPGVGDKESSTESTLQDRPCDAPTDLVVSNTSSTSPDPNTKSVNITWTPPTQPNGDVMYTVYITDSNNITTTINTTTATAHYVVDDLDSFSSYTVAVSAYTVVGYGPESEEVMFVTEEGVPSTSITGLQANLSATAAVLKWTPPSDPNGIIQVYEVHYNDTVDGNYTIVNTTGPEPSIVLEGLEEYWEYMVWIYTYTRMGRGSVYSTPYTLQTEEAVPGPPPISSTIATSRSIAVQWGPPSKYQQNGILQGYYLSYNTTTSGPNILSFSSSVESYTIPDLTPYMNYTLCLWAWNSAGNGSRSCVTDETQQDVPSAPQNLAINEVHPRSITLKWDSPAETNGIILGYTIMYTMEGASDSQEIETTETTGQISDLTAHTGYNIQVAARTVIGQGAKSEPLEATTSIAIPGKPQNVRGTAVNQSAIYVEWEEPQPYPGPTTYAVLVYDAVDDTQRGTFQQFLTTLQAGGMTSLTVLGLKAYNSYYFVIMAMTDAGNTSSDPSAQVTTYPGAPVVDQNVKPQDGSDSTTTTLTVTFTSSMFSEENGPVATYTVFVAEDTENLMDNPSSGHENDTDVLTWYDVRNRDPVPPYQVTEKQQYPFSRGSRSKRQASQSREFVIGEETDCELNREDFCNGPLKPGTTYR